MTPYINNILSKIIKHYKLKNYLMYGVDVAIIFFSMFLAYVIRDNFFGSKVSMTPEYYVVFIMVIPVWLLLLKSTTPAAMPRASKYLVIFFNFARVMLVGFIMTLIIIFIFGLTTISIGMVVLHSFLSLLMLYAARIVALKVFKHHMGTGQTVRNVVIVADAFSDSIIEKIANEKEWGYRILMILSDSKLIKAKFNGKIKIFPERVNIKTIMDIDIVDEVLYCKSRINHNKIQELIKTCEEVGVVFRLQSDLSPISTPNTELVRFQGKPFLTFSNMPKNEMALAWKGILDLMLSAGMLVVLSPLLLFMAILIKFDSKGAVIFKQARVGLRGRQFNIYKFRTMVQNAEKVREQLMAQNEMDGPVFKIKNDPRITRMGRILRKTGLDELPQLYNVVKGEMSLIGPRPPLPSEVSQYERWQLRRLSIKPGITCTWQIIPNRNEIEFENWMKLDLNYIDKWSLKEDFKLLFRTIKTVILGTGA